MLISWFYCFSVLVSIVVAQGLGCDVDELQLLVEGLKYDSKSLLKCEHLIKRLSDCSDKGIPVDGMKNQVLYKSGLIQLSLNQEFRAMSSFERILNSQSTAFRDLAVERLHKLYSEFGLWDKIQSDPNKETFQTLNETSLKKWSKHDLSIVENELPALLQLSPYCYGTRFIYTEALFWKLGQNAEMDIATAHQIIKNFETVLEKTGALLSLLQRLEMHHSISILQMFVVNTEPTHLRKCLAIDMDYEPCKRLTLLHNRMNKINPGRSEILDPEMYTFKLSSEVNWDKLIEFYFHSKKPCIKLATGTKFKNNYELVLSTSTRAINDLLEKYHTASFRGTTEFQKFLDATICQSSLHLHGQKEFIIPMCEKALKEIVSGETIHEYRDGRIAEESLSEIWNTYPHMAIYMIQNILSKSKKSSPAMQDIFLKFYRDNDLNKSKNEYMRAQFEIINKLVQERHQQHQQQQQQQRQWFNFNQHQHQHQQQQQQQSNGINSEKDYYKILDVPKDAEQKQIRRSYLDFTKKYHPDKQGQLSKKEQEINHDKMSQINEAYETLSNSDKRKEYDDLRLGTRKNAMNANMFRQQRSNPNGQPFQFNNFRRNAGFKFQ